MADTLLLPPGVALGIIAFLLSLLPAGLFIWLWYLRRHDRALPASAIAVAFTAGLLLVIPAFWLEDISEKAWLLLSPGTAHNFVGALLPLQNPLDILFPAIGTFLIVATIEEGLRYILLRVWIRRSAVVDQVFDGLLVGIATGLGFATLENTIYFLGLFKDANYDTLVFVFFLRFLISTLAHISFGGIMGALIARGTFHVYNPRRFMIPAFFIPWFVHGLYDLLLGINQSFYAVLLLLPPLFVVMLWTTRRDFLAVHRKNGHMLISEEAPVASHVHAPVSTSEVGVASPWNVHAPWMNQQRRQTRRFMSSLKKDEF